MIKILVLNLGSSSLKFRFYEIGDKEVCLLHGHVDGIGLDRCKISYVIGDKKEHEERQVKTQKEAVKIALKSLLNFKIISSWKEIDAIGHRVVHGGDYFKEAALINNSCISYIKIYEELAPLHNPIQLNGILACKSYMPNMKQVAVFDTAFHQTLPPEAYMYGLPLDYYKKHKIRKYGFHGTSHKYVGDIAASMLRKKSTKIITCHLGNGSSITAIKDGESIDTSMGFTPLDGVLMGTRVGSIDPGAIIYMMENLKMKAKEIDNVLNKESGFLGVSQMVSDFRDILGLAQKENAKALVAKNKFIHQVKSFIGSYAAIMDGVDAIVFTGGIGEKADIARQEICEGLSHLGVKIDNRKNKKNELDISSKNATTKVFVIPTNEELQIAKETAAKIKQFKK